MGSRHANCPVPAHLGEDKRTHAHRPRGRRRLAVGVRDIRLGIILRHPVYFLLFSCARLLLPRVLLIRQTARVPLSSRPGPSSYSDVIALELQRPDVASVFPLCFVDSFYRLLVVNFNPVLRPQNTVFDTEAVWSSGMIPA